MKLASEPASSRSQPRAFLKKHHKSCPRVCRSSLAFAGKKHSVVRDELFLQKPFGSRIWSSRTGVPHSPGSSIIELSSAPTESGAYPPDRTLPGSPCRGALCLSRADTSRRAANWSSEEARTWLGTPSSAN